MHILISPNAFKNSLTAEDAAAAIASGLLQSELECTVNCLPVGDGGDGTGTLLTKLCGGRELEMETVDALGREMHATYGLIENGTVAVIEMAAASGIRHLKSSELDPLKATSFGTGLQLLHALKAKPEKILLCVGGSATVDGATGILRALGCSFYDDKGIARNDLPAAMLEITRIDATEAINRLGGTQLTILCDVANPLIGSNGAAAVFGPQKGATELQVEQLEKRLLHFANLVETLSGVDIKTMKYGGAAGGTAAGLAGLLKAQLENGIDYFLEQVAFDKAIESADLVITGEGSIDRQTLEGKAPYGVALRARDKNVPVIAFAGKVDENDAALLKPFFEEVISINNGDEPLSVQLANARENLMYAARKLGDLLAKKCRLRG
jgi:glycerate kinase